MNPVVTLAAAATGGLRWSSVPGYVGVQIAGAVVGVWLAHAMFELPIIQASTHVRAGPAQWLAEAIAVVGLLATIWGCARHGAPATAAAVAGYIVGEIGRAHV